MSEENKNEINWEAFDIETIFNQSPSDTPDFLSRLENAEKVETKPEEKEKEEVEIKTDEVEIETEEKTEEVKEEVEEEVEVDNSDILPFYEALNKELGIDDEIDPSKIEEGVPGILGYLKELTQNTLEAEREERRALGDGLIGELEDFLEAGGKPEDFKKTYFEQPDYSSLDISGEENVANQKAVIKALLEADGEEAEDINDRLETYENAGILEKEAKSAVKKLDKLNEVKKTKLIEEQKLQHQERLKQIENYWNTVETSIKTSKDIGGLPLPDNKKEAFIKYLRERGKDGLTQHERKLKSDAQASMKMAYASFLDFNFDSLKNTAKTEAVKEVRKAISRFTDTTSKVANKAKNIEEKNNDKNKVSFEGFRLPFHK